MEQHVPAALLRFKKLHAYSDGHWLCCSGGLRPSLLTTVWMVTAVIHEVPIGSVGFAAREHAESGRGERMQYLYYLIRVDL